MKIHEYQGKQLLAKYGVTVPRGVVVRHQQEVPAAVDQLGLPVVVKAQIHAGGRGKGGGVKLARSLDEAVEIARNIIGMKLVTHQTGPEGREVRTVLIEEALRIKQEFYLGIVMDRAISRLVFMASSAGGMEIEEVAANEPEKILKEAIDPAVGLQAFQARKLAFGIGLPKEVVGKAVKFMLALYRAYVDLDASLAEINPFLLTEEGDLYALDAKLNFDDNADFRHPAWKDLFDKDEEDPVELEAKDAGLSYVSLDGDIGCLVNGAGLAMATMDIIKHAGEKHGVAPANFLDVGGGANQEQVTKAFKMILRSPKVKAIFVNIFGGIMKCDVIASGVVAAAKELGLKVPLVVRLEGTNVELGRKILNESGLAIQAATTMADGAQKIVAAVTGGAK